MAAAPVVFPVLLVLPGAMRRCGCCISLYIWTPPSVTPPAIMVSSVMRQGTNYSHQPGDGACTGDGLPSWPYKHYLCSGECAQLYSSEGILYVVLNTSTEYKFTLLCIFIAYFFFYLLWNSGHRLSDCQSQNWKIVYNETKIRLDNFPEQLPQSEWLMIDWSELLWWLMV